MTNDINQATKNDEANEVKEANAEKSIGIHYVGLETRELAIFDRVVAFNITHGLKAHKTTSIEEAELIVINQNDYSSIESNTQINKTFFMVCDGPTSEIVEAQIQRPLLITKVMNTLSEAIESVTQKRLTLSVETLPDETTRQNNVDTIVDNSMTILESSSQINANDGIATEVETTSSDKSENDISEQIEKQGHHALVIDDSASIRKQLELELRDAGISSDFAESGEDALEKIKEGQFDLIFLDIIMPGIDGYETCKQMRAIAEYKKTPIIMLSGKTSPLDEVQGVIAGATTYLTKPVKSDKLQETLNRVTKWIDNFSQTKKTEIA